jgi:FixJ family two-component response regulator
MTPDTIAVVDGDDHLFEQLGDLLEQAAYTVQRFSSSANVVAALQAKPARLVVIDLAFPNYRPGIELATILKLTRRTSALPIILTSAAPECLRLYEEQLQQRNAPKLWTLARPFERAEALRVFAQALGQPALLVREVP